MTRYRLHNVIEYLRGTENHYLIFASGGRAHTFVPDSTEWFAWLAELSSFHFQGQSGHFTARCEHKRRGDYWYAYLKAHQQIHKRYLGTAEKLTLASLEQTARDLHEEVIRNLTEIQLLNKQTSQQMASSPGISVGSLKILWHDSVLKIQTPSESHFLNGTQTAELLSYLYDQRESLLKKRV